MIVYIDADFKCSSTPSEGRTPVDTDVFAGKCPAYIGGYRFVPSGTAWVRQDGVIFQGEMIAPWKPWAELDAAQRKYEREQYLELTAQNTELLDAMAAMVEDVYAQDVAEIEGE